MQKDSRNTQRNIQLHRKIVATFRFNPYGDLLAGIELNNLISKNLWQDLPSEEIVSVIGPADPAGEPKGYVIVADSALNYYDGSCDMIVTDLDGPVDKILNHTESIKVVHAHGDNIQKLVKFVPRMQGVVLGTTQSVPLQRVRNIGGFTDGDRSVIMGVLMGAKKIYIHGFDYARPVDEPRDVKMKKMAFGKEIIDSIKSAEVVYVKR